MPVAGERLPHCPWQRASDSRSCELRLPAYPPRLPTEFDLPPTQIEPRCAEPRSGYTADWDHPLQTVGTADVTTLEHGPEISE